MRLAVYQPDIAPNLGTMIRLCACLDLPIEVIEPCGFPFSVKALRRAAMDYAHLAEITRHDDWAAFQRGVPGRRVLLTTKGEQTIWDFAFQPDDVLLMGRESAGVPDAVAQACEARVVIPMVQGRSLNVAVAAGMALGEAVRQTREQEPAPD
ncbi:tRNA (cytidine(34)-2'-O)-methyltransferase [Paracoccaceae bacterium GXU_MW_L88]